MPVVLVTGGSGLVGSAIRELLLIPEHSKDYSFIFIDSKSCNLTDYSQSLEYFNKIKPDIIIHLAACVGGLFKNLNNKVKMFEDNILINTNVIRIAHLVGVQKLIACLSTCIFPDITNYPINETMLHSSPPHDSNEGYSHAKRMLEVQCRLYSQEYSREYSCIIPTNIYGPHDNFNLEDSHVIPGLIHKCYLASEQNKPFEIMGTGKPVRQFIYSMDLAKIIIVLLKKNFGNIIVSPSKEYSIMDVGNIINSHFNNEIITIPAQDGQFRKTVDNSKLLSIIGDFQFTSIHQGIDNTIKWFIENYMGLKK